MPVLLLIKSFLNTMLFISMLDSINKAYFSLIQFIVCHHCYDFHILIESDKVQIGIRKKFYIKPPPIADRSIKKFLGVILSGKIPTKPRSPSAVFLLTLPQLNIYRWSTIVTM